MHVHAMYVQALVGRTHARSECPPPTGECKDAGIAEASKDAQSVVLCAED